MDKIDLDLFWMFIMFMGAEIPEEGAPEWTH